MKKYKHVHELAVELDGKGYNSDAKKTCNHGDSGYVGHLTDQEGNQLHYCEKCKQYYFVYKHDIEFDVCKAHNNMEDKKVKDGTREQVIKFLKAQKKPFDWDVRATHWDGLHLEMSGHVTGDEFLKDSYQLHDVKDHASRKKDLEKVIVP